MREPIWTLRTSGFSWFATRSASWAHAGTFRVPWPGCVHTTSLTDGPCCGLKKQATRSSGTGSAGNPCLDARERIAAGGQRVDDLADLVGTLDTWDCALRRLVGVQRLLVLDPGVLVELVLPDLAVQSLQLLPEKGDVLVGEAKYALELLCLSAPKRLAVAPLHGVAPSAATDDQGQQ